MPLRKCASRVVVSDGMTRVSACRTRGALISDRAIPATDDTRERVRQLVDRGFLPALQHERPGSSAGTRSWSS